MGIGCEEANCPGDPNCNKDLCPECTCDDSLESPVRR